MNPRRLIYIFIFVIFLNDSSAITAPSDFSVWAAFFPGAGSVTYKNSEPWRLRILPDGKAIQRVARMDSPTRPAYRWKSFKLSQKQLVELAEMVDQTHFFALPEHISKSGVDHQAGLVLTITMRGQTRRVEFDWPTDEKASHNRPALTQFWKVWRSVLKAVPSPNGNSEAVWWLRAVRPDLVGLKQR